MNHEKMIKWGSDYLSKAGFKFAIFATVGKLLSVNDSKNWINQCFRNAVFTFAIFTNDCGWATVGKWLPKFNQTCFSDTGHIKRPQVVPTHAIDLVRGQIKLPHKRKSCVIPYIMVCISLDFTYCTVPWHFSGRYRKYIRNGWIANCIWCERECGQCGPSFNTCRISLTHGHQKKIANVNKALFLSQP